MRTMGMLKMILVGTTLRIAIQKRRRGKVR
jgi:hypothetical protein